MYLYRVKKLNYILFVLIFGLIGKASYANDTVLIVKDARLDILTAKQAQINRRSAMMTSAGMYRGYRLQLISTSKREDALKMKTELMQYFPEHKSYTLFQSPNFKVRIGNFLKREDAEKFRKQLNRYFPKGAYMVEDAIEYIPKEEEIF